MRILPTHHPLQIAVQTRQRPLIRHEYSAPNERRDFQELDAQGDWCGARRSLHGLGVGSFACTARPRDRRATGTDSRRSLGIRLKSNTPRAGNCNTRYAMQRPAPPVLLMTCSQEPCPLHSTPQRSARLRSTRRRRCGPRVTIRFRRARGSAGLILAGALDWRRRREDARRASPRIPRERADHRIPPECNCAPRNLRLRLHR
jgi:hypothetical protein